MKKVCIISSRSFLEEALYTSFELRLIHFQTMNKYKEGAHLYLSAVDIPTIEKILIKPPIKLVDLIEQIKNYFRNNSIMLGNFLLEPQKRILVIGAQEIALTEIECKILQQLYNFPDEPQSKDKLEKQVLGYVKNVQSTSIENHIYKLRQKIKEFSAQELILTTKNGYKINIRGSY